MFERFTEKARRAIFFARYEASQHGTPEIGTACLLLGILRDDKTLMTRLAHGSEALVRLTADAQALIPATVEKTSTTVDMPLSAESARALSYAAEEAEQLKHKFIDPRHLLLGLMKGDAAVAGCLNAHGIDEEKVRAEFPQDPPPDVPDAAQMLGETLEWSRSNIELVRALREIPEDRLGAAITLLNGLASGKFEVGGTSRNGSFQFSFDDKTE